MATGTIGTNATTSLTAIRFKRGYNSGMAPADVASIQQLIKDDKGNSAANIPDSFSYNGVLFIPNRLWIKCLVDDVIAVDSATGWPIIVSKLAATSGPWTTTV